MTKWNHKHGKYLFSTQGSAIIFYYWVSLFEILIASQSMDSDKIKNQIHFIFQ